MFPVVPLVKSINQQTIDQFGVVGQVVINVDSSSAKTVCDQIKSVFGHIDVNIVDNGLSIDELIQLLDSGALRVFTKNVRELRDAGVGIERLITITDDLKEDEQSGGICTTDASDFNLEKSLLPNGGSKLVFSFTNGGDIEIIDESKCDQQLLAEKFINKLKTDREDGLYTTLVVDQDEKALGLVYSSERSITEAIKTKSGVYQSRNRGLWYKGASSGATQKLLKLDTDCDGDCIRFVVDQSGAGFCHTNTVTCFGNYKGISSMEKTLQNRMENAPEGSYTKRLFNDEKLLRAKIMEEAEELCDAKDKNEVAWEAADLIYFALTKVVSEGVSWSDVQKNLDAKSRKISRRKGDAKDKWAEKEGIKTEEKGAEKEEQPKDEGDIKMPRINANECSRQQVDQMLTRPSQKNVDIMKLVLPIIQDVQKRGDAALIDFTAKFEKAKLSSPILKAPFDPKLMELTDKVKQAVDLSIYNVEKFHQAQLSQPMEVETTSGVKCSRFSRPIEKVGLYVPGGTAVLPSTALMLGVPAMVAGCKDIVIATPPRSDGTPTPEVVYVAHKIGAKSIVLAGGAQAVAAMAYGTESVDKVDKIMGPGNQFVTAAKMHVSNDTKALVSIDMPAGPSEVLVVADKDANPAFVASDLLSQAEHGIDSQVVLIAVDMNEEELAKVEKELHDQAMKLPRVDIVRGAIAHSLTLQVDTYAKAFELSNQYGPEHLILQINNASDYVKLVDNAGSVFVGAFSPESCGDYSSGTNHTLPTYGYAKMYSGVNTATFQKHITSQELTAEGLKNIGSAVMTLAEIEGLEAHRNAVQVRLDSM